MSNDAELLKSQVENYREKRRVKAKDRYQLAMGLGFSSYEAAILCSWSEERIRSLAESKAKGF